MPTNASCRCDHRAHPSPTIHVSSSNDVPSGKTMITNSCSSHEQFSYTRSPALRSANLWVGCRASQRFILKQPHAPAFNWKVPDGSRKDLTTRYNVLAHLYSPCTSPSAAGKGDFKDCPWVLIRPSQQIPLKTLNYTCPIGEMEDHSHANTNTCLV